MALTRREFLLQSFGAMGAATLALESIGMRHAFAQAADYKALVCIFLFGGSDQNNVVIPFDNYAEYAALRPTAATLGIPQASLLQITPPSAGASFGLHPSLAGIKQLWDAQKAAVVCNVGPLVEPTSRSTYLNGSAQLPFSLFSHSDQQTEWQTSVANGFMSTGWAGRSADAVAEIFPASSGFPIQVSMAGTPIFTTGVIEAPLAISPAPATLRTALRLDGFGDIPENNPRYQTMLNLQAIDDGFTLVRATNRITKKAVEITTLLRNIQEPVIGGFPASGLGNQLLQAAKLISLRNTLGIKRQIFFCSLGGFDTHNGQVNGADATQGAHAGLLLQVSDAMKAFYDATAAMGVANQVTTFSMSDFSRTGKANGGVGSDHAWGSHMIVAGGAVRGGDFYGNRGPNNTVFPTLSAGGPDDTDSGGNARGRWIPTTSIEQLGATLATWFGVPAADLNAVFPNLPNFSVKNLGFMM
ncbi:MAG: DUF1501 domain-containing protein [Deltaproteobacteria bacterium]|nr:DUF1501 domain-containing protein [Deltaproteobacteria bacterium]